MEKGDDINPGQDSTPETERKRIDAVRRMQPWERIQLWSHLTMMRRAAILEEVRRQYPQANADELRKRFAARVLPREDVIRIFGWNPEQESS